MDFYQIPIGFGLALSSNTAPRNRYAHLGEVQEQEILNAVKIEKEMYGLVNRLSNGMIS